MNNRLKSYYLQNLMVEVQNKMWSKSVTIHTNVVPDAEKEQLILEINTLNSILKDLEVLDEKANEIA